VLFCKNRLRPVKKTGAPRLMRTSREYHAGKKRNRPIGRDRRCNRRVMACAFFHTRDEEYQVSYPLGKAVEEGDRNFQTSDKAAYAGALDKWERESGVITADAERTGPARGSPCGPMPIWWRPVVSTTLAPRWMRPSSMRQAARLRIDAVCGRTWNGTLEDLPGSCHRHRRA